VTIELGSREINRTVASGIGDNYLWKSKEEKPNTCLKIQERNSTEEVVADTGRGT
jgi:hypothetical protein